MPRALSLALALLAVSAQAGGGAPRLSPLGVPYSDTVTLHCRSGRSILFFAPNIQSVRLLYRGKVSALMYRSDAEYSDVGLPGPANWDTPRLGNGLEWRSLATSGRVAPKSKFYRAVQHADGRRELTLLERCSS